MRTKTNRLCAGVNINVTIDSSYCRIYGINGSIHLVDIKIHAYLQGIMALLTLLGVRGVVCACPCSERRYLSVISLHANERDIGNRKLDRDDYRSDQEQFDSDVIGRDTGTMGLGILYYKDRRRSYKEQDAAVQQPLARSSETGPFL